MTIRNDQFVFKLGAFVETYSKLHTHFPHTHRNNYEKPNNVIQAEVKRLPSLYPIRTYFKSLTKGISSLEMLKDQWGWAEPFSVKWITTFLDDDALHSNYPEMSYPNRILLCTAFHCCNDFKSTKNYMKKNV